MNGITRKVMRGLTAVATVALLAPQPLAFAQEGAEPNDVPRVYIPLVGGGPAPRQQTESDSAVYVVSEAEAAAAEAYWTEAMLASAEAQASADAATALAEALPSKATVAAAALQGAEGPPGSAAGMLPDPMADAEAKRDFPDAWEAVEAEAVDMATAAALDAPDAGSGSYSTYSSWRGNYYTPMWRDFPFRTVGKLYSTRPNGTSRICTATVISSRNIIATSADCIYDTTVNRFHSNVVFYPALRGSSAPYGSFRAAVLTIPPTYISATSWSTGIHSDVGLVRLSTNSSGRPVTYYTGSLGRTWNNSYVRNLVEIGYSSHFSPYYTSVSTAESFAYRTDILGFGSPFRGTGVGSPLIMGFAPYQTAGYVSGVHGGWLTSGSTGLGARFTTSNFVSRCNALGGC